MDREIAADPVGVSRPATRVGLSLEAIRRSEWVVLIFLAYSAVLSAVLPLAPFITERVILLNLAVFCTCLLLIYFDHRRRILALNVIRDWMPLAIVLLAYQEVGWFARPHPTHPLEIMWVKWDRAFLGSGVSAAIGALGPVLPSLLEISYTLVYTLAPFSLAVLYLYRKRQQADKLLFVITIGVLLCYAQFPFWPSEPPRTVFAGQDLPAADTIFRRFNLWILSNAGIHTSVFPSAHVAAAFSAAFGMRKALPEHRWVARFLFVLALVIALATVYGRYHYLADAIAGFTMALVAAAISWFAGSRRHAA